MKVLLINDAEAVSAISKTLERFSSSNLEYTNRKLQEKEDKLNSYYLKRKSEENSLEQSSLKEAIEKQQEMHLSMRF